MVAESVLHRVAGCNLFFRCDWTEMHLGRRVAMRVLGQEKKYGVGVDRMRKEKSLTEFATEQSQLLILFLGLNSFRDYFHAQVASERRDGSDDRIVVVGR